MLSTAEVTPSQRLNERVHRPWAALNTSAATALCVHCTCAASSNKIETAKFFINEEPDLCSGIGKIEVYFSICYDCCNHMQHMKAPFLKL